jgi:hypothetical protein
MAVSLEEALLLTKQQNKIIDQLADQQSAQAERLTVMREVVGRAGRTFTNMRIDVLEGSLAEEGPPWWASVIIGVMVTMVPVTAITAVFLTRMTTGLQRAFTSAAEAHKDILLTGADKSIKHALKGGPASGTFRNMAETQLVKAEHIQKQLAQAEASRARFVARYEPELADSMRRGLLYLGDMAGKHIFGRAAAKPNELEKRTGFPSVAVEEHMLRWVREVEQAETIAYRRKRDRARALFDIATSSDEGEAKTRIKSYEQVLDQEPRPKDRKDAVRELGEWAKMVGDANDETLGKVTPEDLLDLQLFMECAMWCVTYDFSLRKPHIPGVRQQTLKEHDLGDWLPAPLPAALWKRLIERYRDPDANGRSYKEVGNHGYIGPMREVKKNAKTEYRESGWSPELRLSHYLSQVLRPKLDAEAKQIKQHLQTELRSKLK